MARKADLLTLLSKRSKEPTTPGPARPADKPKAPGSNGPKGASTHGAIKAWFARFRPAAAGAPKAGPSTGKPAPIRIPGLGLAAIVACSLGLGFVLGRAFGGRPDPSGGSPQQELRAPAGKQGLEPDWLADPSVAPTGPEMQAQALAKWYLPVLLYGAQQRDAAERLAAYLRGHEIKSARIRYFDKVPVPGESEGKPCWGTVIYVQSRESGARYLDELRKVPAPTFETKFTDCIGTLEGMVASGTAPINK